MKDNVVLALAILILLGFLMNAAYQIAVDKNFEKCFEKQYKKCVSTSSVLDDKSCEDFAVDFCLIKEAK